MLIYTTRQVAEMLGSTEWKVRRLFEDGTLPQAQKFGNKRVITEEMIPAIIEAFRERDWEVNEDAFPSAFCMADEDNKGGEL